MAQYFLLRSVIRVRPSVNRDAGVNLGAKIAGGESTELAI
jgi:hypothetical protein